MKSLMLLLIIGGTAVYGKVLKRVAGNTCKEDMPFPCPESNKCIPIGFLCDDNVDCEDGYDEKPEVCAAARRVPVSQTEKFIHTQKWLRKIFEDKPAAKVAHALATSPTIDDFQDSLGLSDAAVQDLEDVLDAVASGNRRALRGMGMPASSFSETEMLFGKLLASDFL